MPFDDPWLATASVTGLAFFCATHLIGSRFLRFANPYRPVQFGFGVGFGATMMETWHVLATAHAAPEDAGALLALNAFCYFALAYGYFGFVNLNLTSLRIRILAEILECGGELPTSELFARYGMDHVATIRMRRLIAGRHLLERNGRIYNDRRLLLFVARVIRVLQIAILGSDPAAGEVANRDMGG